MAVAFNINASFNNGMEQDLILAHVEALAQGEGETRIYCCGSGDCTGGALIVNGTAQKTPCK